MAEKPIWSFLSFCQNDESSGRAPCFSFLPFEHVALWHCLCLPSGHCLKNTLLEQKWADVNLVRPIYRKYENRRMVSNTCTLFKPTNLHVWNGAESMHSALEMCKKFYISFLNQPILTITCWDIIEQSVSNCNVSTMCVHFCSAFTPWIIVHPMGKEGYINKLNHIIQSREETWGQKFTLVWTYLYIALKIC